MTQSLKGDFKLRQTEQILIEPGPGTALNLDPDSNAHFRKRCLCWSN